MARILLVEDSPTQAVEMTMLLEEANHDVIHASNGRLGLEQLRSQTIDVVVTDLEMPEMNGLKLVERMRIDFAHVPTILVTGHGSEALAAEALRLGAAGYVPKNQMRRSLNDSITNVLSVIGSDNSYARLISTLRKNVFVFDLPNDPQLIPPLIGLLMQISAGMELLPSVDMVRMGVAIEHAIANAMCHGNLEVATADCPSHSELARNGTISPAMEQRLADPVYKQRKVRVEATATSEEIRVTVTDQGNGFDTSIVPRPGEMDIEAIFSNDDASKGQGLVLMANLVDELVFNEKGNEVTLVKRCG
ncbi:Histidine kinase-like ATPase domain-containing protein [Neorhodopirellula lusitana]|uniref:Histidine kinase-like ATPase domain-containing protein n=1 Tax=Neorhodopirellula lusitana TaxID=445327 RepID=A0ABY1QDJ2_9BACT|nr:response regulator [Neorhodopirellula lusitana]SMP68200.1 Histidine kinase-like ATPase domain-containing protein [Neorhodopirellula lusitana]